MRQVTLQRSARNEARALGTPNNALQGYPGLTQLSAQHGHAVATHPQPQRQPWQRHAPSAAAEHGGRWALLQPKASEAGVRYTYQRPLAHERCAGQLQCATAHEGCVSFGTPSSMNAGGRRYALNNRIPRQNPSAVMMSRPQPVWLPPAAHAACMPRHAHVSSGHADGPMLGNKTNQLQHTLHAAAALRAPSGSPASRTQPSAVSSERLTAVS
jgi:hypothetical protein